MHTYKARMYHTYLTYNIFLYIHIYDMYMKYIGNSAFLLIIST